MSCPKCGALARPDATWCGQCHAAFEAAPTPVSTRFVPVAAGPAVEPVYSRWKAGPMSMGPVGRVSWTLGVLLVAAFAAFSADIFFIGIWCLFVGPMILRSVWKSHRIV